MATLIAAYRGQDLVGRCDARCYDARSTACKCICFGANHLTRDQVTVTGRGLTQLEMHLQDSGLPSMRVAASGELAAEVFWTVHLDPIDRPGTAVACRWRIEHGQLRPDNKRLEAATLEDLRALRPAGLSSAAPAEGDPPSIREVWLPDAA